MPSDTIRDTAVGGPAERASTMRGHGHQISLDLFDRL
jgi:hypothetical protein